MARTVKFYSMNIDKRYLDKSAGMTQQGNDLTTAHFKDDTELINPVLILSDFDQSLVNYVYIPSLDRYYYVTGVTYSEGYYYIALHCDVLMSFKNSIKKQQVIVKRSGDADKIDLFMQDDKLKTEQYTHDVYKGFEGGTAFSPSTNTFVLAVMGTGEPSNNS